MRQQFVLKYRERCQLVGGCLGHVGFILGFATYYMTEMFNIRCGVITASLLMLIFQGLTPAPQWVTVTWHAFYIVINSWQIYRLVGDSPPPLSWEEAELHQLFENIISMRQFQPLVELGEWRWLVDGAFLVEEGGEALPDSMFIVVDGSCEISVRGHKLGDLGPGSFVGEVPLVSDNSQMANTVTVRARGAVRCLVVPVARLRELIQTKPELQVPFGRLFLHALAAKAAAMRDDIWQQQYRVALHAAASAGSKATSALANFQMAHHVPEDLHAKLAAELLP